MKQEIIKGNQGVPRACGWLWHGAGTDREHPCGREAAVHISFGSWCGFVCAGHEQMVLSNFEYCAYHHLQADCGMAGSFFDVSANTCRYHGDELPTVERVDQEIPA